jgi:hypothetical protein
MPTEQYTGHLTAQEAADSAIRSSSGVNSGKVGEFEAG